LKSISRGECVKVTDNEATQFLNASEDRLDRNLQYQSIYLDNCSRNAPLAREANFIRSNLPRDCLLVMLDTTTVQNALRCLDGIVTPLNLLDLGILTFASVCFDRVVVQPSGAFNRKKIDKHSDIFSMIKYPKESFITETLWNMCASISNEVSPSCETKSEFEEAWCHFLGVPSGEIKLNLRAWDRYQDSPPFWNGIMASYYADFTDEDNLRPEGNKTERDEFLSIQTMRLLFNDELAGFLGLPYLSSSFRSCIHSNLIAKKVEMRLLLDKLISSIGPRPPEPDMDYPYASECSAPFLLGLILEQMERPDDFWSILGNYRRRFAPLRKKILEDKDKWIGGSSNYLRGFLGVFNDISEDFKRGKTP